MVLNGNFECGDIIFVRGNSPFSFLIQLFDGSFSHCCIALSSDRIIESQRFTKTTIVEFDYDNYEVVHMTLTEDQKYMLLKLSVQFVSKEYDYEKIWGYVLRKVFGSTERNLYNNRDKLLCSELCEVLLYGVGKLSIDENFGDKSPAELYGYLKDIMNKGIIETFVET